MGDLREVNDQMGREVLVPIEPKRIISLVPSQTELLCDLGLDDEVVGITKFCVHPAHWRKSKTVVGGTKKFRFDIIKSLKPDLIIGNKEENYQEGIETLMKEYPVWMSDIFDLSDAVDMITSIGKLIGRREQAVVMADKINNGFEQSVVTDKGNVLYLIWKDPYMAAGRKTFIDQMLGKAGYRNLIVDRNRYPEMSIEEIIALKPKNVLLSSEPFPFKDKHLEELKVFLPETEIKLVDGEIFSWYGSRLLKAPEYFKEI